MRNAICCLNINGEDSAKIRNTIYYLYISISITLVISAKGISYSIKNSYFHFAKIRLIVYVLYKNTHKNIKFQFVESADNCV